jgi:hypothetical protein
MNGSDGIGAAEMRRRLINICTGNEMLFPRKLRDRHVMLFAASSTFERGMIYTEKEIDTAIRNWLDRGCPSLMIDEVTLRRELIDANYLMRDDAGRFYAVGQGPTEVSFTQDAAAIDPVMVVADALADRAARKREHFGKGSN